MDNSLLNTVVLFLSTSIIAVVVIAVFWFILEGIGLFKIAKENNIKNSWLAWIPFGQSYLLGKIIGDKVWGLGSASWILLLGQILLAFLPLFFNLTLTFLIIYSVLALIYYFYFQSALNTLYKMQDPDKSILYLLLGFLFPFLIPIWIFVLRNKREPYYKNYHQENNY